MLTYLNSFFETMEKEFYINKFHLNFKDVFILDGFREDDKF